MKKLIALTFMIMSISAAAGMTRVDSPNTAFGTRYIDVTKTCVEGENLRTTSEVKIYRQVLGNRDTTWEYVGMDFLYKPMTYKKEVCVGSGNRCEFIWITETIKRDYVFDVVRDRGDSEVIVGVQEYSIPDCQ